MRHAEDEPGELRVGRDPDELDREAESVSAAEQQLSGELAAKSQALTAASAYATERETARQAEEARLAALVRAASDRREGLARLNGQVSSLRSRAAAAEAEIGRLAAAQQEAAERADQAARAFTALETKVAGLDAGELGLDAKHESAVETLDAIEAQLAELRRQELAAAQDRAALAARVEALHVGLNRKDASSALLAATDQVEGLLGSVAALVGVQAGYETAVAAAFGAAADAVAVAGLDAAVGAFGHLKAEDLGRAGLLLGGAAPSEQPSDWPALPASARYAVDVVTVPDELRGAVQRVLRKVAVVDELPAAQDLVAGLPDLVAVTRDGDVLSAHFAAGGSSAQPSLIEVQAAIDEAEQRLTEAGHRCDRLRFAQSQLEEQQRDASAAVEETLSRLHESDAAMAALAEQLGQLGSTARSASEENERLAQAITRAEQARDSDISGLAELEHRLELAETAEEAEPDPGERDRLTERGPTQPRRGDGGQARPADAGGAGPRSGRPGRRAAQGGDGATAGPGPGAGPPRPRTPGGRDGGRRACRGRVPGRCGRALAGPGRGGAVGGGGGADRGRGRLDGRPGARCARWGPSSSRWSTRPIGTRWPGPSSGCGWRR